MQVQPIVNAVQAALASQGSLAGGDVAVEEAIDHLTVGTRACDPPGGDGSRRAGRVRGARQLPDRTVDVILSDGDPSLRIAESAVTNESNSAEELDARITLRIPPSLKSLIEDAADTSGASVNSWVLDALSRRARKPSNTQGFRATHSFDL